jgi:iron complex outermembrane receptor protein
MNTSVLLSVLLSLYPATTSAQTSEAKPKQRQARASDSKARKAKRVLIAQAAPAPAPKPPAPAPAAPPAAPAPAAPPAAAAPAPAAPPAAAPAAPPAAEAPPAEAAPPAAAPPAEAAPPPAAEAPPAGEPIPSDVPPEETGDVPYQDTEEDVIRVTVDRREKDIQDYSGSATVLGEQSFDRLGITNIRNMSNTNPYVEIGVQEGNAEVFIRGIGSTNNTELGDPAVATHIDGVYIPRPRGVGSMVFDINRVEVNRGPQGTLYGRNSIGGTLNVVTNEPKFKELAAEATVQLGNYKQRVLQGMLNVPVGETLAVRLALFSEVHSAFFKNAGPIHTLEPAESANHYAYRASAKWQPFDALTIRVTHDMTREGGTGYTGSNYDGPLTAGILPEEVPDPRAVWYRGPQGMQDLKHWGITGDIGLDLKALSVKYVGSYRDLDYRQITHGNAGVDYHGKPAPDLDNWSTSYWHTTSKSVVQELRLVAPDTARFRWTVGGFFFNEEQKGFLGSTNDKTNGFSGVEFTMPDMHSHSYAGFADGTFDITDAIRALAGVRVTTEKKERTGIGHVYSFGSQEGTPSLPDFRFGTEGFRWAEWDRTNYSGGADAAMPPFDAFTNGVANFGVRDTILEALAEDRATIPGGNLNPQKGESDDTFFDFRVGGEIDFTPDNMMYVTFTTGHKSGGFNDNVTIPATPDPNGPTVSVAPSYKPETLYSLEIGSKNELMDKTITANASAFWYSYKDQQFQSIVALAPPPEDGGSPPASSIRYNAASSRVLGLEVDARVKLPLDFLATLQALLMNAEFTEGEVADTRIGFDAQSQGKFPLEGNKLMRSPTLAINYSIGQTITTGIGYFDWLLMGQTKTKQYMTVFNGEGRDKDGNINPSLSDVVPSYTRFDASVGYTHSEGRLRLEGFVTNLNDVTHMTSIINTPGLNLRFFNPPRQYGMRMTVYL